MQRRGGGEGGGRGGVREKIHTNPMIILELRAVICDYKILTVVLFQ